MNVLFITILISGHLQCFSPLFVSFGKFFGSSELQSVHTTQVNCGFLMLNLVQKKAFAPSDAFFYSIAKAK